MSKDEIHNMANRDTPKSVEIPNTWPGLAAWAMVRLGPTLMIVISFVGVTMWAINKVYNDLSVTNKIVLELVMDQTVTNTTTATAITELSRQVEKNTKAMEEAHQRAAGYSP